MEERHEVAGKRCWAGDLTHGGEARSGWEEVLGGVTWPLNAGGGWVWAGSGGRWGGSLVPDETVRMRKPFTLG